jgi:hypothetical protein
MKTDNLSALKALIAILRTAQNDVTCKEREKLEVFRECIK